eukprot:3986062-Ditylum_brightwellii.AAC.3
MASDTWRQCIISIAMYMTIYLEEQRRKVQKARQYGHGEAECYQKKLTNFFVPCLAVKMKIKQQWRIIWLLVMLAWVHHKKKRIAPTIAAQSDMAAQMAVDARFLVSATAIDIIQYPSCQDSDPYNGVFLIHLNEVNHSKPSGGRLSENCCAEEPRLTVISSNKNDAKRIIGSYASKNCNKKAPNK